MPRHTCPLAALACQGKQSWSFHGVMSSQAAVQSGTGMQARIRMTNNLLIMNSMGEETREIADGLRRGDADRLDELISRYQYRLLRYLWTLTGNRDAAEDIFQETWIRVLEKGHLYSPRSRFGTWLFSIARNLVIDRFRRGQPESLDALLERGEKSRPREWPDGKTASPLESVAAGERAARVQGLLHRLPPEAREVLVLRFQEELSLIEIAGVMRVPLSTVKSRLYRGLKALRNRLGNVKIGRVNNFARPAKLA